LTYYPIVLQASIESEIAGEDYICSEKDRNLLKDLFEDINNYASTDFHYLAELDTFSIEGVSDIALKHIEKFESEAIRKILMWQVVADKIKDCDKYVLKWYLHFKESNEYISKPNTPSPAHIYAGYDNAFTRLKPKRLKDELLKLAYNPRDFHYLPLTMQMLSSWKLPELLDVLISYLDDETITFESVGLGSGVENVYPSLEFIKKEAKFTALYGLRYYPSEYTRDLIINYIEDPNPDIRELAKKTLRIIEKKI